MVKLREVDVKRYAEAVASGRKNEIRRVMGIIGDELQALPKSKNPFKSGQQMTDDELDDYLDKLEDDAKILSKPEDVKQVQAREDLLTLLRENVKYNFKEITLDRLRTSKFNQASILFDKQAFQNKNFADDMKRTVKMYKDAVELTKNESDNLAALLQKVKKEAGKRASRKQRGALKRRSVKIRKIIDKPDFATLEGRNKIYAYWERVAKSYPALEKDIEAFIKYADKIKDKMDDDFEKKIERLERTWKASNSDLQYVVEVDTAPLVLNPADIRAFDLMEQYLITRGLDRKPSEGITGRSQEQLDEERRKFTERGKATQGTKGGYIGEDSGMTAEEEQQESFDAPTYADITPAEMDDPRNRTLTVEEQRRIEYEEEVGWLENIETEVKDVDPLLNYYFQENDFFVPISSSDLEAIKRELREFEGVFSNPKMNKEFAELIEDLEENIEEYSGNEKFYLPFTNTMRNVKVKAGEATTNDKGEEVIPYKFEDKYDDISKNIADFLDSLASLLEDYETQFPFYRKKGEKAVSGIPDPDRSSAKNQAAQMGGQMQDEIFPELSLPGLLGKKSAILIEDENFNKRLEKLLKKVNDYYIMPIENTRFNFDDEMPRWRSDHKVAQPAMDRISLYIDNPITEMIKEYTRVGTARMSESRLKSVNIFLNDITGSIVQYDSEVRATGLKAADALIKMLGKSNRGIIESWVGSSLYSTVRTSQQNNKEFTFPYKGKNQTLKWHYNKYDKLNDSELNPILQLAGLIRRFGKDMEADEDIRREVKAFTENMNKLNRKSKLEIRLMEVHDEIRKMKGLPIVYNRYYLNDPDSLDTVVSKMEVKHNVDLAASEVYEIVKTVDSFKSIARNHGITEELVYELKANFR